MSTQVSIVLLSLLTGFLPVTAQHLASSLAAFPTSNQLLAAKTQHGENPPPPPGRGLRQFYQLQAILNS
ncbi:MAG TPA: hypothetical protein V6C95_03950 [Coleofasciculaceae cyanobacterium]